MSHFSSEVNVVEYKKFRNLVTRIPELRIAPQNLTKKNLWSIIELSLKLEARLGGGQAEN